MQLIFELLFFINIKDRRFARYLKVIFYLALSTDGFKFSTVKPHQKVTWYISPVYPNGKHPFVRTTGTLQNVPLDYFIISHIRYHDGDLNEFRIMVVGNFKKCIENYAV